MILRRTVLVILALFAVSLLGCGNRDNPADPSDDPHGLVFRYDRIFNSDELGGGDRTENWVNYRTRTTRIYTPPGYVFDPPGEGTKFPTLYLLHDFLNYPDSGLAFMFNRIDLIADRLIASGEIKPMVIVMPDVSTPVGGSFVEDGWSLFDYDPYADKKRAGEFEKMIYRDLLGMIEPEITPGNPEPFSVIRKRASRAIGGVGMGGYGALKIALKHPEYFSSVSSVNGFVALAERLDVIADSVFSEIGVQEGDSAGFFAAFDSSFSRPYTELMISMCSAFSPHDTLGTYGLTFVSKFGIDLPFDYHGQIVQSVMDRWLSKDVTATLLGQLGSVLDSTALFFSAGVDDQYGAASQAAAMKQKLDQIGANYEYSAFSGYSGYPAYRGAFDSQQLEEILKFHSKHMSNEP